MASDDTSVWFIADRATGLGRGLAGAVRKRVWRVAATARRRRSRAPDGRVMRGAAGAVGLLLGLTAAAAQPAYQPASWPDDATSRLEALALLETLNADLLGHASATLTLERWCGSHGLASPPTVTAARVPEAEVPADEAVRARLGVDAAEPVRHRHVRLSCGGHVVSEADNYYLPARLTPEMNRALDATDTAFGRAVAALHFLRRTEAAELLWRPLPEGWEGAEALPPPSPGGLAVPREVLRHRAVLVLPDGTPFSALVETYTGEVLAFPKPPPR